MEPDFDEDDLINDYIEEGDFPDEDMMEEMMEEAMGEAPPAKQQVAPTVVENAPPTTVIAPNLFDDDDSSLEGPIARNIFDNPQKKKKRSNDLYTFERYTAAASETWGKDSSTPDKGILKAHSWKKAVARSSPQKSVVLAPDAQLLQLGRRSKQPSSVRTCPLPALPSEHSMPVTLSDGNRVFVRPRTNRSTVSTESNTSLLLGESIQSLSHKVHRRSNNQHKSTHRSHTTQDARLWVDQYAPTSFVHLLSDERTNREVVRALRAWDPYVFRRAAPARPSYYQQFHPPEDEAADHRPPENARVLLLSGPPGVGKTTLAHIVAQHVGYRPLEVNGSDERSAAVLTERVQRAMETTTLDMSGAPSRPNCLILDEIDGADAKGAVEALVRIIRAEIPPKGVKASKHPYLRRPIIFICNNKYAPALRPLLPYARQFDVGPPANARLVARIRAVLTAEKISLIGGGSMLNQLVQNTSGDIRSSLNTLQFVASQAQHTARDPSLVDISRGLRDHLGGDRQLKDGRSDLASTVTKVFMAEKKGAFGVAKSKEPSTNSVMDAVQRFDDPERVLDTIFLNVSSVSYVDPSFERSSLAHEWLSTADVFRSHRTMAASNNASIAYALQSTQTPPTAAAIHLLCRVEQKPDLLLSARQMTECHFERESKRALAQSFVEGMLITRRGSRTIDHAVTELIPYMLWILSAGGGSCNLNRTTTSMSMLSPTEQEAVAQHVKTMVSMGLSYKFHDSDAVATMQTASIQFDPPIHRLVEYRELENTRIEVPNTMKELIMAWASQEKIRATSRASSSPTKALSSTKTNSKSPSSAEKRLAGQARAPPAKKSKTTGSKNFLAAGAKRAKENRAARAAARVGTLGQRTTKLSHTGSQLPLSQVVRLKFVKGFTQAVRTPCRIEDLN